MVFLAVVTALLAAVSLLWAPGELLALSARAPDLARTIMFELRLPRTLLGLLIGGGLGIGGAAMQALLRNPLASPDVLGPSTGAALGAVIAGYFLGGGVVAMEIGGIGGAMLALALLVALAGRGAGTATLILAGVAISALAGASVNLALSLAPSPYALYDVMFWLMGSLADRSLPQLLMTAPVMLAAGAVLAAQRGRLDTLALGEDVAASLGVDVARLRWTVIIAVGVMTGAAVAAAGSIGFVGLIVPHLVRPFVAGRPGAALLPSALAGAALLSAADIMVRLPLADQEIKLGVFTALAGAPFFLWLVVRSR
ncbi:iron ABC transporter permease [Sandarakinorhabdus sp.]|uniref:FecCD family ABC transporter permease n=1 Tax=Sandarakinorhabdus sp. TaxID=1916663 RepID=UPI00286DDDE7|nr:iron ABC transporter permease [Sandarakinorhabdus sp.]